MGKSLASVMLILLCSGCAGEPNCAPHGNEAPSSAKKNNGPELLPILYSLVSEKTDIDGLSIVLTKTNISNEPVSVRCTASGESQEDGFFAYDFRSETWVDMYGQTHAPNFALAENRGQSYAGKADTRSRWRPRVLGGGDDCPVQLEPGQSHSHKYLIARLFSLDETRSYAFYVADYDGDHILASCLLNGGTAEKH